MSNAEATAKRVDWYIIQGVSVEVAEAIVRAEAKQLGVANE